MPSTPHRQRKPEWLRKPVLSPELRNVRQLLRDLNLNTVCEEASCPNIAECFGQGTATFMIGGDRCTRRCHYCDVTTAKPFPLDPREPNNVAEAAARLGLKYVVVTAVARDDVKDGGARHFARTINAIRQRLPEAEVEVLIPDFKGDADALKTVLDAEPHVLNHNIETVRSVFKSVRAQGDYDRSLALLARSREFAPQISTKSGFMVGLGETTNEIYQTMDDLKQVGVELVTIGQYLQPSLTHVAVSEYIPPERYELYRSYGQQLGFRATFAGPFIRSSFHAGELHHQQISNDVASPVQEWIALEPR
ncbi:lipoyl synthase [Herpetosiphon llansteffanensis]|uniref:lipoyl synthase n=1 Tax=Herpetosiphon llansteffanensis TaxID=2094568 RepID=UPI000D7D100C|nr:lipoyl synthase [Herpetosiphon llansteffanensis]